ncbi:WGR domain-containing protein [Aurantimonas aggregata]|uniref:WGR domain-containing protein n=1 Tax=Aurantimonas aggregata TaxID=2047720 RepID=A0A6L9MMP9_9HYPH|nr:WGR domain-containing protein [Aurantimonas aggregata]NDV89169.1 WGR domain-containing protein [Aurantimonas aggregata]
MKPLVQLDLFPIDLHLQRIDSAKNMRRFYVARIEPNLFGEWCVVRRWGRIGARGQQKTEWFDNAGRAHDALGRVARGKRRRGYK